MTFYITRSPFHLINILNFPTVLLDLIHYLLLHHHLPSMRTTICFFVNSPFLWNSVPEVLEITNSSHFHWPLSLSTGFMFCCIAKYFCVPCLLYIYLLFCTCSFILYVCLCKGSMFAGFAFVLPLSLTKLII